MAGYGDRLDAKQFKQRPYKNITADREEVDPRKPCRQGELDFARLSNRPTACSISIWKRPGTILKRGIAKIRISAAAMSRIPVTTMPEIRPGLTSFRPKRLTCPVSCKNGVPHRLLDRFGFGGRTDQDGRRRQQDDHGNPDDDENLLFLRFHRHLLLVKAARGWTGPRGRRLSGLPPGSRPDREAAVSCLGKRGNQFCLPWH